MAAFHSLGGIATTQGIAKIMKKKSEQIARQLGAMNGVWIIKHPTPTGINTVWVLKSCGISGMEIHMPGYGAMHGMKTKAARLQKEKERDKEEITLSHKAIRRQNARIQRIEERNNDLQLKLIEETGYEAKLRRFYLGDIAEGARIEKCAADRILESEAANRKLEDVMIIEGRESA